VITLKEIHPFCSMINNLKEIYLPKRVAINIASHEHIQSYLKVTLKNTKETLYGEGPDFIFVKQSLYFECF